MAIFCKHKCSCIKSMKVKTALKLIWGFDIILWGYDEYVWGQRSTLGHVWPSEVTMNMPEVRGWDMMWKVKTQLKATHSPKLIFDLRHTHCDLSAWRHTLNNFKAALIFIDLAQLHFCMAHKNSLRVIIDCHTPVNLQLGEIQMLLYLITCKRQILTKYLKHFKLRVFALFTSFWCTM